MDVAELTKVKLVRCPKCTNLLPEHPDYPFYLCGGCGTVLEGTRNRDKVGSPSSSDATIVNGVVAQLSELRENDTMRVSDMSDLEIKSNTGSEVLRSNDKKLDIADNSTSVKAMCDEVIVDDDIRVDGIRTEEKFPRGKERENVVEENEHLSRAMRSGRISGLQIGERGRMEGVRGVLDERYAAPPVDGPSNLTLNYSYGRRDDSNGVRAPYVEDDRAVLLRKLEELKEQLSRSSMLTDRPTEVPRMTGRVGSPCQGGCSGSNCSQLQLPGVHNQLPGNHYMNRQLEEYANGIMHPKLMHGIHPSIQNSIGTQIPMFGNSPGSHMPMCGDSPTSQMPRIDSLPVQGHNHGSPHGQFPYHIYEKNPQLFDPYRPTPNFHPAMCSCYHCFNKHSGLPASHHHEVPIVWPSGHNSRNPNPIPLPMRGRVFESHSRWTGNGNTEINHLANFNRQKVATRGRLYYPKGGGAPFISCKKCFDLLIIPEKVLLVAGKWQKIQCGSCSAIINVSLTDKKLLSCNVEQEQRPVVGNESSNNMINDNSFDHGHAGRTNMTFSSVDFDDSGYDFQAVDPDPIESAKAVELQSFSSSSRSFYENSNLDVSTGPRDDSNTMEKLLKENHSGSMPESPLQLQDNSSNHNSSVSRSGKGSRSRRSDQEKVLTDKASARQNSMKEVTIATETDVSYQEYSNTVVSEDALSHHADLPSKTSKSDSFFTQFIKNFKDGSKSSQSEDGLKTVSVNGHIIPRRLVAKAEKYAGPIYPGSYWYDNQAGFWGVMGGHCLGMIPPLIKEFNYPMQVNCSNGDTGVFVNGRELHRKDLELLGSRGLPTERNRFYIVNISGKVVDEDTGKELDSLGKLAPTIEKRKLGFGMKVPKVITA